MSEPISQSFIEYGHGLSDRPLTGIEQGLTLFDRAIARDGEVDAYQRPDITDAFLALMEQQGAKYETSLFGVNLVVHPKVLSPKYEWGTQLQIETMPNPLGKDILDMGCGTGAIAIFCDRQGAARSDAADISAHAVANCRENYARFSVKGAVYHSDLFLALPQQAYDIIHFNLPYHGFKPNSTIEQSVSDENYQVYGRFIVEAAARLKPFGKICIQFSNYSDVRLIAEKWQAAGLKLGDFYSHYAGFYTYIAVLLAD